MPEAVVHFRPGFQALVGPVNKVVAEGSIGAKVVLNCES